MNILVLTPSLYDTSPGPRFRFEQWARYLEREGFRFTFAPFEDEALHQILYQPGRTARKATLILRALLRRLALLRHSRRYDLVLLHREAAIIGPAAIESLLARTGVPIVYDFDDPIWLSYRSPSNGFFSRLKCPAKTATICRLAAAVIVGNRLLAGWATRHARNVHVVPSTIDLERYPVKPYHSRNAKVTLGWTGSHSTVPFLMLLENVLRRLASTHSFRLVVISHTDSSPFSNLPVEVVAKRWQASTEAADLHEIDIGLAPFPNTGWTPWRCHGKVLQYMAAGIPTVGSAIGVMPDYIRDGVNGFLAASEDEWVAKLAALIDMPSGVLRKAGLAGRKTIEDDYSAHVWAPRVREILESAARMGRRDRTNDE